MARTRRTQDAGGRRQEVGGNTLPTTATRLPSVTSKLIFLYPPVSTSLPVLDLPEHRHGPGPGPPGEGGVPDGHLAGQGVTGDAGERHLAARQDGETSSGCMEGRGYLVGSISAVFRNSFILPMETAPCKVYM